MIVYIGHMPTWFAFAFMDVWQFFMASVYDVMPEVSYLLLASIPTMAYPRSRRASFATWHHVMGNSPRWARLALKYGWLCPGYIDEIGVFAFIVTWFFIAPARRRALFSAVHSAWIG